jgi:hypothetical protein
MAIPPQDRPLSALRDDAVDQLIVNYGHGKLSLEAFERRLDAALDAQSHAELGELTHDLELHVDKSYAEQKRRELGIASGAEQRDEPQGSDDVEHMINVFGSSNRSGAWDVPVQINMVNVFGGAELDFTNARFTAKTTTITMLCLFGGAQFYVREGINTVSKAVCIFGGVDNRGPSTADRDAPTIVLRGLAIFGGAGIKVRKSAKERLLEFAESVRSMFEPAEQRRRSAK